MTRHSIDEAQLREQQRSELRDRFAVAAMAAFVGLCSGPTDPMLDWPAIALSSYELADAMLAAREAK